jgi:hypothetical protein
MKDIEELMGRLVGHVLKEQHEDDARDRPKDGKRHVMLQFMDDEITFLRHVPTIIAHPCRRQKGPAQGSGPLKTTLLKNELF